MIATQQFKCRICGHDEYAAMFPDSYVCKGCSIIFKDPDKFSIDTNQVAEWITSRLDIIKDHKMEIRTCNELKP